MIRRSPPPSIYGFLSAAGHEDEERDYQMSVIGEKQADITGKITSVTVTSEGNAVNLETDVGPLGTVMATVTFGPPVDSAAETGPITIHGQIFGPEGEVRGFVSAGTWRKSGHHKWEIKHIPLATDGQRMFVVDDFDLATRSTNGAVYALD